MKLSTPLYFGACQLISAGLIGLCCQSAQAQLLFSEGFNYTAGAGLANQVNPGNSVAWTGGNNAELTIGSSQLSYAGLQQAPGNDLVYTSSGSASTSYNTYNAVTSGSIYYSFLIDCTTLPTANEFISSLNPGVATPNGSSDALAMYVGASGSGWKMGVRTTGGGTGANFSGALNLNQTYLVVGELTLGSAPVANLYLDPTPGGSQPGTPTATQPTATAITSVDDVGFKVQSTTATGDFVIDDLLVGQTWGDVTPALSTPEPETFALLGAGMLFLPAVWRRLRSRG